MHILFCKYSVSSPHSGLFPCPAHPLQSEGSSEMALTPVSHTPFLSAVCACPVFLNLEILHHEVYFRSAGNLYSARKFSFNQQFSGLKSRD